MKELPSYMEEIGLDHDPIPYVERNRKALEQKKKEFLDDILGKRAVMFQGGESRLQRP